MRLDFHPTFRVLSGNGPLVTQTNAELIDEVLATGKKSGYQFTYTVLTTDAQGNVTSYSVNADPRPELYRDPAFLCGPDGGDPRERYRAGAATDNPLQ